MLCEERLSKNTKTLTTSKINNITAYSTVVDLNKSTRLLDYNVDGLNACGSLATTIVFMYYYDYINNKFGNSLFSSNPLYMFNTIRNKIEPNKTGTNTIQLYTGIYNSYKLVTNLNSITLTVTEKSMAGHCLYAINDLKVPCILNIWDHPDYDKHWVVVHGVKRYYVNNKCKYCWLVVNNGWGKDNILVSDHYAKALIYITNYN